MYLSIAAAVVTILLKFTAYKVTGSIGFFSDALESIVNLLAAVFGLIMLHVSEKPADEGHEFGHSTAEYFSSAIEGSLILLAAFSIIWSAVPRLIHPIALENINIGFTSYNYWVSFEIDNSSDQNLHYYLETARPVTDIVNLFTIYETGAIKAARSGDNIPFTQRSYPHRKPLFEVNLKPGDKQRFFLHLKSDGEVINMPLLLRSPKDLVKITQLEQIVFGIFYGILIFSSIIYLFFFFGIRERSFLYYSCYMIFIGLMQFSLDGYFFQYITPQAGWFSDHSVIIFACFSTFFLGKYAQQFLRIKLYSVVIDKLFNALYVGVALLFILVFINK